MHRSAGPIGDIGHHLGVLPVLHLLPHAAGGWRTGDFTIRWNTGEESVYRHPFTGQGAGAIDIVLNHGTIISGRYAGATGIGVIAIAALPVLSCLPPGLQAQHGATTLTILSVTQ